MEIPCPALANLVAELATPAPGLISDDLAPTTAVWPLELRRALDKHKLLYPDVYAGQLAHSGRHELVADAADHLLGQCRRTSAHGFEWPGRHALRHPFSSVRTSHLWGAGSQCAGFAAGSHRQCRFGIQAYTGGYVLYQAAVRWWQGLGTLPAVFPVSWGLATGPALLGPVGGILIDNYCLLRR